MADSPSTSSSAETAPAASAGSDAAGAPGGSGEAPAARTSTGAGVSVAPRVAEPRIEIVPAAGVERSARAALAPGARVAVTCLPHHGIRDGVETSLALVREGLAPSTHLAARRFSSRAQLLDVLRTLHDGGVDDLFLIGGDGADAEGPFTDGTALLQAVRETGLPFRVGVAGYPEHATARGGASHLDVLAAKAPHADYLVTQICFTARTIADYVDEVRGRGVELPVAVGVPAPIGLARLLRVSARIGVAASAAIASKLDGAHRLVTGRFDASRLLRELRGMPATADAGIHVYSFNDLDAAARLLSATRGG